jgi:hypothetical protein
MIPNSSEPRCPRAGHARPLRPAPTILSILFILSDCQGRTGVRPYTRGIDRPALGR